MLRSLLALLVASFVLAQPLAAHKDREEIEKIVREYLVENPEVLIEVSNALRQKQMQEQQTQMAQLVVENADELLSNSTMAIGRRYSPAVTVVEFFDYQCGHCVRSHSAVKSIVENNTDVRVVLKQLPILGEVSAYAAKAVIAAKQQRKDLDLHNALMERAPGERLSEESVLRIAREQGIDVSKLEADMESQETGREIANSIQLAGKLQIRATPAFIVAADDAKDPESIYLHPGGLRSPNDLQNLIEKARTQ